MCRRKTFLYYAGLLLLILHVQETCGATNNYKQRCAPSSCGEISNISYPFRLKDHDPENCGNPKYELACENNRTVLTLFSGKYFVKSIDYRNFTIRLVDSSIQEGDCSSIPRYSLSVSNFTSYYVYDYVGDPYEIYDRYVYADSRQEPVQVIYLNCRNPVLDDPVYADTAPCLNSLSTGGHLYAIVGDLSAGRLKRDCHVKLIAMTSSPAALDGTDDQQPTQNLSYAQIHKSLIYGFNLSWIHGPCQDLNCPNDPRCYFNETSGDLGCVSVTTDYCTSPLGFDVICEHLSEQRIFVEDIIFGFAKGGAQITGHKLSDRISGNISDFDFALKIGRETAYVLLPYFLLRFTLGFIVLFSLLTYTFRRRHISIYENIEVFLQGNTMMPIRYSYREIKKMTGYFSEKLGEGGFGCVYKGKLRSGPLVAIKMLGKSKGNGQDFINEVATIGRIHHSNVVRLIGFCVEGSKRALVYEFMPNGSLDRYISSKENAITLTHKQMYEISLGVARGISYLHEGCDMQILHFDIKPHNILLDDNFAPKVSDFGLAKLYPIDNSIVTLTAARGTIGYMAPELFYQNIGRVSYKADVYSFGMLLMEMASKRRNLNAHADRSSQLYFPFWIYNQLVEEREVEMDEITDEEKNNVKKMFLVALWCIQLKPIDRPSMKKVIEMLEGNIENIEMPPKPLLYPNEMIQGDLDVESEETTEPLLTNSA